jgi:cleavage and polyadenylation specificity factor subunit 1
MHALRQEILPPSGVEFATSLKLTPSTLADQVLPTPPNSSTRQELAARALCNVVVARTSLLRIFEVREEPAPLPTEAEDERDRKSKVRRGTEAVEGEVEMDEQGEGFVNMGSAKVIQNTSFDVSYTECEIDFLLPTVCHL